MRIWWPELALFGLSCALFGLYLWFDAIGAAL